MKKLSLICIVALGACLVCCKKTTNKNSSGSYTPDCSGTTPTFASTVGPLISSACATSGCHASGSNNGPGALTSYAQIKSSMSTVRSSVVNGNMPQNSTLTTAQRNTIVCWIDAGAPNN